MRTIRKGAEPNSLAQHRHTDGADYQNYRDKDALRTFLVREQRGLCCYCMARVRADRDAMKIEHWHSQSGHPQEQLDYTNLLASCMGNDGRYNAERYCDSSKGERELSRNRANPLHAVESLTHFLGDGRIASSNHAFEAELNQVLNLNVSYLVNSRKGVLTAFQAAMGKRELSQAVLQKWLEDWDGESKSGDLRPFCGVVVYWLRKRLART